MTDTEMRKAIGVLVDALWNVAVDGGTDIDGIDAQRLLVRAGLLSVRPATDDDVKECEWDIEVGDDWFELTSFAHRCRTVAGLDR